MLLREAAFEWIRAYAVATHWKDKIPPAIDRLNQLRRQVLEGADFGYLIVENSMEPGADKSGGDLGTVGRGSLVPIFEMRAMTGPLNEVSEPFPTVFGWHILQVLSRDLSDPENPKFHVRHLLLVHGLDPANEDLIQQEQGANVMRWTSLAQVVILADELKEVLPEYVQNSPSTDAGSGPAGRQDSAGGTG
jgi:parvulin-like peptidyl-prolyl isomerase